MSKKDWVGNISTAFGQIGARNFAQSEREENDFYASPPQTIDDLFSMEKFEGNIWEPACGKGHMAKRIEELTNSKVYSTDLINRGYGVGGIDFLLENKTWDGHIITNPPYRYAQLFAETGLKLITENKKMAMLLKIQFLEGKSRKKFFDKCPPKNVYVWSGRISCALNGKFEDIKHGSPMMFAWFVWQKGYTGDTILKWIN